MNIHTVDPQTMYRTQEKMWKWLESLFASDEPAATSEATATATAAAEIQEGAACACYDDWRTLGALESGQSYDRASERWTLGKE